MRMMELLLKGLACCGQKLFGEPYSQANVGYQVMRLV